MNSHKEHRKVHTQPMPTPNKSESIHELVIKDVLKRKEIGLERYNSILQANNGRDALQDAYEEALDLCCYLRQLIEEKLNTK